MWLRSRPRGLAQRSSRDFTKGKRNAKMQKRKLGESNLEVSAIGFGCMGLNFSYGHALSKERASRSFAKPWIAASPSSIRQRSTDGLKKTSFRPGSRGSTAMKRFSGNSCPPFSSQFRGFGDEYYF